MSLKYAIRILPLFVLFFSCTKGGGNIYVEGRVYNPITGEGIKGAELKLIRPETGGTIGNSAGNKIVESTTTDADGHYKISHLGGLHTYRLRIEVDIDQYYSLGVAPNAFEVPEGNSAFIVDKGTNMEVDFEVVPYGYFKFKYLNQSCFDSNDIIEVYREINYEDYYGFQNPIYYEGCTSFTQEGYAKVPSGIWYFKWYVTKNGVTTMYSDTVLLEGGEYRTYEFLY